MNTHELKDPLEDSDGGAWTDCNQYSPEIGQIVELKQVLLNVAQFCKDEIGP